MPDRNWSAITSDGMFQHLVNTLLLRVDPAASPYGKSGKDCAIDARSGDQKTVYQAKYHKNATAADAIRDAKAELAKIRQYRLEGTRCAPLWEGVETWCLVTNSTFNPTDDKRWGAEIKPIFNAESLSADIWRREHLDALLDRYSEIDREFFGGENRVLLSLWEAVERYRRDCAIMPDGKLGPFCGRENELAQIIKFGQDAEKLFMLLHGAGAAGKTRLLLAAGARLAENGAQVLWAEAASMARSSNWFLTLQREKPTILLLDEPADLDLLKILLEQLSQPSTAWKVVIAVRSTNDPVFRWLTQGRQAQYTMQLALNELPAAEAIAALEGMLATADQAITAEAATEVVGFLDGFPGWLEIAARLIAKRGTMAGFPTSSAHVAKEYLDQILGSDPPANTLRELLQQVALYGRLNRDDSSLIAHVAERCSSSKDSVLRTLAEQVQRRVLVERGAYNRLVEIKPDVMRDFILQSWLTSPIATNRWKPSDNARALSAGAGELLRQEAGTREAHALLSALARTEFMLHLDGKNVDLLGGFINEVKKQATTASPSHLIRLVVAMQVIADVRPGDAVRVSSLVRSLNPEKEEIGLVRKCMLGKAQAVGKLPWMLFHAARGASEPDQRTAVINELLEITAFQGTSEKGLGESAASLLGRIIAGGPEIGFDFTAEAGAIALNRIEKLAQGTETPDQVAASRALLNPLISIQRTQSWFADGKFHIATGVITAESQAGQLRTQLIERMKALIRSKGALPAKRKLWGLLANACGDLNSTWLDSNKTNDQLKSEMLDFLQFAKQELQHANFAALSAARPIWRWHAFYGSGGDVKDIALCLEAQYNTNALAAEMEPLFGHEQWEHHSENLRAKAQDLASKPATEILAFLDRVETYSSSQPGGIEQQLAWSLGRLGPQNKSVQEFIRQLLGREIDWRLNFAVIAASAWVCQLRPEATAGITLTDLLSLCRDDAGKRTLLVKTLGRQNADPPPTKHERDLFFEQIHLFADQLFDLAGVAANLFISDLDRCKVAFQDAIERLNDKQLAIRLIGLLCENLLPVAGNLPQGTGEWLLDQILVAPHLYSLLHSNDRFYLEHVVAKCGRPDANWLLKALRARIAMENQSGEQFGFLGNESLAAFVEPLTNTNIDVQRSATVEIVQMAINKGSVGHDMPAILPRLDPVGLAVPNALAKLLMTLSGRQEFLGAARCIGEFPEDSGPWRTLARVVLERAEKDPHHAVDYYTTLTSRGPKVFQGSISKNATAAAEAAERAVTGESDPLIKAYKEWKSQAAMANAEHWAELDKEHELEP